MPKLLATALVLPLLGFASLARADLSWCWYCDTEYFRHIYLPVTPGQDYGRAEFAISSGFPDGQEDILEYGAIYMWYWFARGVESGYLYPSIQSYVLLDDIEPHPYKVVYDHQYKRPGDQETVEVVLQGLGFVALLNLTFKFTAEACTIASSYKPIEWSPTTLPVYRLVADGTACDDDNPSTPASSCWSGLCLAQAAPTASNVTLSGSAEVGQTLTGSYTYADAESDPQDTSPSGSSYRIVRSTDNDVTTTGDNADAATGGTGGDNDAYTVAGADAGSHLFYCVTPRATSGLPTGAEVCSSAAQVPAPPADGACGSDHGQTLTDTPTQLCATGAASTVTPGTTSYDWTCNGTGGSTVNAACSATRNYLVTPSAGANGSISPATPQQLAYNATPSFTVTPNPNYIALVGGTCGGSLVGSTYTTSAVTANCSVVATFVAQTAPTASNVTLSGSAVVGQTMTGSYAYADAESDLQDTSPTGSSYRIVRSTDNDVTTTGDNADAATGSTGGDNDAYTVAGADAGNHLFYCVTPRATSGLPSGTEVCSSASAQVPTPVDGACGSDHGQTLTDTPTNLCATGAALTVTPGTTSYDWTCNGTGGSTVNAACSATRNYLVTPSAGANGSISPATPQQLAYNATPSFTVTPNPNYIASVGGTCGGNLVGSTYTTESVTANCSVSATFGVENDGVDAAIEDDAPNGGDSNGDGILDSQQQNVASLPRPDGGYLTIATSCAAGMTGVQTYTEASQGGGDPLYNLPYGQVGFSAACENATFTVYYHGVSSVADMTYRKYGPSAPGNPATMAWYTLPNVIFGTASVDGQTVATATFTLNDNQLGDDTGNDGVIVDQGGPGNAVGATAIPTLSEWSMILLSGLLAIGTALNLRRKHR